MKNTKSAALIALLALTGFTISGSLQAASYDFDGASDYEYGRSKYEAYYSSYLSACGSYETINESDIFGEKVSYDTLYPVIGQMDAELEQITAINSSTRRSLDSLFKETKKVMDIGYTMEKAHSLQLAEMKKNTENMGGEQYYNRAQKQVTVARQDLDKAIEMKYQDGKSKALRLLKSDARRDGRNDEVEPSSFDRWQDCKSFWSYAEINKAQLKGKGYSNSGSRNYR